MTDENAAKKTDDTTDKTKKAQRAKIAEIQFGDVIASAHIKADREPNPTDLRRAVHALRELADELEAKIPAGSEALMR